MNTLHKRGFTLIELMITVAIIAAATAIFFVNYSYARSASRDARRKADVGTYVDAISSYRLVKGSALIEGTGRKCTLNVVDNQCRGAKGESFGRMNLLKTSENGMIYAGGATMATALNTQGYLTTIAYDPIAKRSTTAAGQRDYVLIRCNQDGTQAMGRSDSAFAVWTYLENPQNLTATDLSNTVHNCGGSKTAAGAFQFGYAGSVESSGLMPAPAPKSNDEATKGYFSAGMGNLSTLP